jgi:hypothetical protein
MTASLGLAADYSSARARFVRAAQDVSATVESRPIPERGVAGEELAVDTAWLGPADATSVIMVVSGTHGVEGYAGSMCQSRWLETHDASILPAGIALLFVHALNPYGFSWVRRVNEDNVDLNRNFADFDDPPANPGYDALAEALSPAEWTDEAQEASNAVILAWAERQGFDQLQGAISGGQYHYPDGLFYGGTQPVRSHHLLHHLVDAQLARAERVALLDLHTGLGERGEVELISHELPDSEAFARSRRWWGERVISTEAEGSVSASLSGEWMPAVQRWLAPIEVTGVALEWGTVDGIAVVQALRADNWLHHHGDPTGPEAPAIKAALRDAFAPDDPTWTEQIWACFVDYVDRTLAALAP